MEKQVEHVCVGYREKQVEHVCVRYREKQVDKCGWVSHMSGHGATAGSFLYNQGPPAQGPACRHSPAGLTPAAQNKQPFLAGMTSMSAPANPPAAR